MNYKPHLLLSPFLLCCLWFSSVYSFLPDGGNVDRYEQMLTLLKAGTLTHEDTKIEKPSDEVVGDTSFGTLTLSRQNQLETALNIMSYNDMHRHLPSNVMFTQDAWKSLQLLTGSPAVVDSLGTHSTVFGRLFLAKILTSPTTDITRLKRRQDLIVQLQLAQSCRAKIKDNLKKIARLEAHLLSLSHEDHPIYGDDIRLFHHKWLPRKLKMHDRNTENFSKILGDIWFSIGPLFAFGGMIAALIKKLYEVNTNRTFSINRWLQVSHAPGNRDAILQRLDVTRSTANILMGAAGMYCGVQLSRALYWGYRRWQALHYIYHQLKPLHEMFEAFREIRYLTKQLPALESLTDEIDMTVTDGDDPDLGFLRHLLNGTGFNNALSGQAFGGDIVIAADLLLECRKKMFKGVGLIGALDAYIALSEWYEQGQVDGAPSVCLAEFVQKPEPHLQVDKCWHPCLVNRGVMANSITFGGPEHTQNNIITGLFESGKSTFLNSVALNVLCAQTIGICPARSYQATPFSMINIYAKIKDDLANKRSLFKTELYRVLQLLDHIKSLPEGCFSFAIADTTFSGTEAGAGQAAAYAVARYLCHLDNSVTSTATNFISLALLANHEPDRFSNYHFPTTGTERAEHSYQLTPGAVQQPELATLIFKEENLPQTMQDIMNQQLVASAPPAIAEEGAA